MTNQKMKYWNGLMIDKENLKIKKLAGIWKKRLNTSDILLPYEKKFFSKLLKICCQSERVLEIGIGKGRMVNILKQYGCETKFFGIDIWKPDIKFDSNNFMFVMADARKLPFKNETFELVYSLGVIEHFDETEIALYEHARVVKRGGYVLVTTPRLSIYTLIRLIVYFLKEKHKGSFKEIIGKNLTLRYIKKIFQKAGLRIIEAYAIGTYMPKIVFLRKLLPFLLPEKLFGAYLVCIGKKE